MINLFADTIFCIVFRNRLSEHLAVVDVGQPEGVGDSVEERKERGDVDCLGNLSVVPAYLPQTFGVGGSVGVFRHQAHKFEQHSFGLAQRSGF